MDHFSGLVTFCYVADLERSAAFYENVIGLELTLDQGTCRIYRVTESAYLGFCEREGAGPEGVILCLLTEDVEGMCARLVERGAVLEKEPQANPQYRIVHAFLRDPDGYLIEVQRFEDERWKGPAGR